MFTFKKFAVVSLAALTAVLSISCSDSEDDEKEWKDLNKKKITLSYAGTSYADLDANKTYKQSELSGKKGDIDIVAYYTSGAADEVVNPCNVFGDECDLLVTLYEIPSKYHSQLATGETTEDIKGFLDAFVNDEIDTDDNEADEISISKGSAFLVLSSKGKYFYVIITNTGAELVDLDFSGVGVQ